MVINSIELPIKNSDQQNELNPLLPNTHDQSLETLEEHDSYKKWCSKSFKKKYGIPVLSSGISALVGLPFFLYLGGALSGVTAITIKISGLFGSFGLGAYTGKKFSTIDIYDDNIWTCILSELDIDKIKEHCNTDNPIERGCHIEYIKFILNDMKSPMYQIRQLHEYIYSKRNSNPLIDMRDMLRNIYALIFHIYHLHDGDIYVFDEVINTIDKVIIPKYYRNILIYCNTAFSIEYSKFQDAFYSLPDGNLLDILKPIQEKLISEFIELSNAVTPIEKANIIQQLMDSMQNELHKHGKVLNTDILLDNWLVIMQMASINDIYIEFKYMEPFLVHKKNKYGFIITNFEMLISSTIKTT